MGTYAALSVASISPRRRKYDPVKRAEALVQVVAEHQVISDRTAAWVHGINTFTQTEMAQLPAVETCAVRGHTRTRRPAPTAARATSCPKTSRSSEAYV